MAIQPDIALQAAPEVQFDPIGSASKGITLKNLMTEAEFKRPKLEADIASTRAATEQTLAATRNTEQEMARNRLRLEQEQRELATRKTMSDLLKKHTKIDSKTGKVLSDFGAAADEATTLGIDIGTLHEYIAKDADNAKKRIDNTKDATEFADKTIDRAMNQIRTAAPEQVPAILQSAKLAVEKATGHVMSPEEVQKYVSNGFGLPAEGPPIDPATGQPDLAGTVKMLKDRANTYAASTISPQQAITNKQRDTEQAQEWVRIRQAAEQNATGPEYIDANSAVSKNARERLAALGIKVPASMSYSQILRNSDFVAALEGNVVGAGTKAEATKEAHTFDAKARLTDQWVNAAKGVKQINITPLAILSNKFDQKLLNDPAFQEYAARVKEMNAAGIELPEVAPAAVASVAKKMGDDFRKQAEDAKKVTTKGTYTSTSSSAVGRKATFGGKPHIKIKAGPDNDRSTWREE